VGYPLTAVVLTWLTKLLNVANTGGVNDRTWNRFGRSSLPQRFAGGDPHRIAPKAREFQSMGFDTKRAVIFEIDDLFNNSHHYMAAMDAWMARRLEDYFAGGGKPRPPKTNFYCDILTETADGGFLWTNGDKLRLKEPPEMHVVRAPNATVHNYGRHTKRR